MNSTDVLAAMPLIALVSISSVMLTLELLGMKTARLLWLSAAFISAWVLSISSCGASTTAFSGLVFVDTYTFLMNSLVLVGGLFSLYLGHGLLAKQGVKDSVDVDMLVVLAVCGGMVMVSAAHLIVLFVGFELLSVSVYVLAGLAKEQRASSESAFKYFILGAFSSAFLLYGMALVYAACGSMSIPVIAGEAYRAGPLMFAGLGLLLFGFAFKVSLAPFHLWTPDVYQGAPTSLTTFMAVVVKVAAFASFLRLMVLGFGSLVDVWAGLIWALAVLSMCVGNLIALRQDSIKRMLAYSSIAHAGYILMGFLSFEGGAEASIFYLVGYTFMTLVSFGVVLLVTAHSDKQYHSDTVESFRGLGWSQPLLGFVMVVAMLSLAGIPPLVGFFGKFYIFTAVVSQGYIWLAIIAAINSAIALYYYLRVIVVMYFSAEDVERNAVPAVGFAPMVTIVVSTFAILYLGFFSGGMYQMAVQAVKSLSAL